MARSVRTRLLQIVSQLETNARPRKLKLLRFDGSNVSCVSVFVAGSWSFTLQSRSDSTCSHEGLPAGTSPNCSRHWISFSYQQSQVELHAFITVCRRVAVAPHCDAQFNSPAPLSLLDYTCMNPKGCTVQLTERRSAAGRRRCFSNADAMKHRQTGSPSPCYLHTWAVSLLEQFHQLRTLYMFIAHSSCSQARCARLCAPLLAPFDSPWAINRLITITTLGASQISHVPAPQQASTQILIHPLLLDIGFRHCLITGWRCCPVCHHTRS